MFGKKKKCKHEYELVGNYYKEFLTQYRNSFDQIVTFRKFKCLKCGEIYNESLTTEEFEPQMYKGREIRKKEYLLDLKAMGFKQEVELMK